MTSDTMPLGKQALRKKLRAERREHVAALPKAVRALVFSRPPAAALTLVPDGATIGLYSPGEGEAPTVGYARWFHEIGYALALPWFSERDSRMEFRRWNDPYADDALESGPYSHSQPRPDAPTAQPDVLFVPLIGFTASGDRLGQGGGHYDRWLEAHPDVPAIGLAWDCQRVDALPAEPHDRKLAMIVTPTRAYTGEE
jgi:5-formyltetrahydrofolate cyclo-ligase